MSEQTLLTCVSCDNEFDPEPTGGFCPECDTPHPDYDIDDISDLDDSVADEGVGDGDAAADPGEETDDEFKTGDYDELAAEADAEAEEATDAEAAEPADADSGVEETDDSGGAAPAEPEADAPGESEPEVEDEPEPADAESGVTDSGAAEEPGETEPAVEDETGTAESGPDQVTCSSCGTDVDASMSFCPSCGTELDEEETEPETDEAEDPLASCPACGADVSGESYCPDCGEDLDTFREDLTGESAGSPREVTLVVNGERYSFEDGDTFGRQDEPWLQDLVKASGGRDDVTYVSSQHLEFDVGDDGVYVTDVSTNGTKLNGEALDGDRAEIEDGDVLELGGRAEVEVEL